MKKIFIILTLVLVNSFLSAQQSVQDFSGTYTLVKSDDGYLRIDYLRLTVIDKSIPKYHAKQLTLFRSYVDNSLHEISDTMEFDVTQKGNILMRDENTDFILDSKGVMLDTKLYYINDGTNPAYFNVIAREKMCGCKSGAYNYSRKNITLLSKTPIKYFDQKNTEPSSDFATAISKGFIQKNSVKEHKALSTTHSKKAVVTLEEPCTNLISPKIDQFIGIQDFSDVVIKIIENEVTDDDEVTVFLNRNKLLTKAPLFKTGYSLPITIIKDVTLTWCACNQGTNDVNTGKLIVEEMSGDQIIKTHNLDINLKTGQQKSVFIYRIKNNSSTSVNN